MFNVSRDHKLFFQAYNDSSDIDGDGHLDTGYKHSIDYYGYFDPYKCYAHSGGITASDQFTPVSKTADKFCSTGQWSGNVLNWMTMTRIDVLRKVLYGGYRSTDSTSSTVLQKATVWQDAHSFGKELTGRLCNQGSTYTYTCVDSNDCDSGYTCVDKSLNLIGFAAADAPTVCAGPVTVNWVTTNSPGNILIAKYSHPLHLGTCGDYSVTVTPDPIDPLAPPTITVNDTIYGSFEVSPANYLDSFYISDFNYTDSSASNHDVNPTKDHGDNYNIFAVSEFSVATSAKGNWQFLLDSDDGSELLIDGQIVTTYPACHSACFTGTLFPPPATVTAATICATGLAYGTSPATVNLTAGWHRLLVRQSENTGQDGIRVWYKKPGDANWTIFGSTLSLRAPSISASNDCSIKSPYFIDTGTPVAGTSKRHLFCNTALNSDNTGTPRLRIVKNSTHRIWDWSAKERPVCDSIYSDNTAISPAPSDYVVRVEVCNSTAGVEDNCKNYNNIYKPTGLIQRYGEGDGTKVCSKGFSKSCNSDTDCGSGEGLCIYKAPMYFGLLTGSYTHNHQGGVLRKNVSSILDEVNTNGIVQTSQNVPGNIIASLDKLQVIDFSGGVYQNCGWLETRSPNDGECRMWGNPIAEMLYESLRYFAGKGVSTAAFDYSTNTDAGVNLSHPAWGKFSAGSSTYKPYDVYPSCAKPFILLLSDVNSSYDADQLPNSAFGSFSEDTNLPILNMQTASIANQIGTTEGISGGNWFVGQSGTTYDTYCSSKSITNLSQVLGICPEEPTKQGSFYAAAVAYYGRTLFNASTGNPNVNTFAVALTSPFPDMKFKVGTSFVSIVPTGKSVDGCLSVSTACWANCSSSTIDTNGLNLTCSSNAFCPTNQIVNVFMDRVEYDNQNNVIYARFRINFEDSEQGADFDMDAIVTYEICTPSSVNMAGTTCNNLLASNQIEVKLSSDYAAGCIDQALGFIISGTTEDRTYLAVKDRDVGTSSHITSLGLTWQKTFTVNATGSTTGFLHNPLWYTAKWGAFVDTNGNGIPDNVNEWAKNNGTDPDNYYLVVNPLKLEAQLNQALLDILARASSGTAASILNNSEGSGANLLQAVFYPLKQFDNNTQVNWIGEIQNLWYYLDPNLQKTSIREDTNQNNTLNLKNDYVAQFYFDSGQNKTFVKLFADANGDGAADNPSSPVATVTPDDVKSLWKAGRILWERDLTTAPRTIYTNFSLTGSGAPRTFDKITTGPGFLALPGALAALQAADNTEAAKIVDFVSGIDQTGYRNRKVTILNCGLPSCTREWKLGDIVSSTPKLVSNVRLNSYSLTPPLGYNDASYDTFTQSTAYKNRGMAFVGGNDGMLHAFKLGVLQEINSLFDKSMIVNAYGDTLPATSAANLGKEQWAFIPKNSLPYLKYLADPNYSHLYYIDRTSSIVDVSINRPLTCDATLVPNSSDCEKKSSSWRTVLIGGMGYGGAAKTSTDLCSAPASCVKPPVADTGYSSYFALDVTDPNNPVYLWEFPNQSDTTHAAALGTLGFSTSGPAIVRISTKVKDGAGNDTTTPDNDKNGKWFAVFASGPTGPIDTTLHRFKGESDQQLRLFILDLATGTLLRTITTDSAGNALPSNAFSGSLATSVIDADRSNANAKGYYSDDAVYIGYVQKDTSVTPNTWTKGGVLRLLTKESRDPSQWVVSKVIDNIGPVTTSVTKLQDRKYSNLWLFFGTGRFFFKQDDPSNQQKLYGVKEPCYSTATRLFQTKIPGGTYNQIDPSCTDSVVDTLSNPIVNQSGTSTTAPATTISTAASGWYLNLDAATASYNAERAITDPIAAGNGAVFFTTFKPSADICKFGGDSLIWALRYDTGGLPPSAAMQGRALMQVSTGAFAEISLKDGFSNPSDLRYDGRRLASPIAGVPPTAQGLSLLTNPKPIKKLLHIQEK